LQSKTMHSTMITIAALFLSAFFAVVGAIPLSLAGRDVYVPPVTYPVAGTVWIVNQTQTVTWDTSNPPNSITNTIGTIMLRKDNLTTPLILAEGFPILSGSQQVTVPWVIDGTDYQIVCTFLYLLLVLSDKRGY
ncbi:hypothetical protein H0H81_004238, partial [Sphagnurus paluster]